MNNLRKTLTAIGIASLTGVGACMNANAALPANALLTLTDGTQVQTCAHDTNLSGGICFSIVMQNYGSWYNMSGLGNTLMANHEGIKIGVAQPASGTHSLPPNGTESPSIDEPWSFFENTGMHFTPAGSTGITIHSDTSNVDSTVILDFSNWSVTWNGISRINMGGDPANFDPSVNTGFATMTCAATCADGDTFTLVYKATVPHQDPSNFGGVAYTLYLAGSISTQTPQVSIGVSGGNTQECTSFGGSNVDLTTVIDSSATVASVMWTVDNVLTGNGNTLNQLLSVGTHSVDVEVMFSDGSTETSQTSVTIEDTTPPAVEASFLDPTTGTAITSITKRGRFTSDYTVTDVCDSNPSVTAITGMSSITQDGGTMTVANGRNGTTLKTEAPIDSLELSVTATDNMGNTSSANATLSIQ